MAARIRRILAPNAGPMTLDGTNTWVLEGADGVLVVDPGPLDAAHVDALAALPVRLIVVTHHHHDHTEAAAELARRTGAPVRGADAAWCVDAEPVVDGEVLAVGDVRATVVVAPGHTADSIALHVSAADVAAGDAVEIALGGAAASGATEVASAAAPADGVVLTGDTILGRGTTIIARPDGSLGDYLATLDRLETFGDALVLPGHGDALPSLAGIVRAYREHRMQRLAEVREALAAIGADASADALVGAVTDRVYPEVDAAVRFAAEASVEAQLAYLRAG